MLLHNILHENWGGCIGTEEYHRTTGETAGRVEHYRSTEEAVLVQQTTIGGLGRLS